MHLDAVIFGGGAAGLWLLDDLARRGCAVVLLESAELGRGQTISSQGIIHGGLKYTLQGLFTRSAQAIREMPSVWRECLAGSREPNLSPVSLRADHCYLWRTDSVASRLGMFGAKIGLRVSPQSIDATERPAILAGCPGSVARLHEQVICPRGLIETLSERHRERILKTAPDRGVRFACRDAGWVDEITLTTADRTQSLLLRPRRVVFAAGAGNAGLRHAAGLDAQAMQRRPLHMLLCRGLSLPRLNGHCVDGRKTRVTITSDVDSAGRTVWQIGGQLAEAGVDQADSQLIAHAAAELRQVLPGIDLDSLEWSSYRVDRAEAATQSGQRPDNVQILAEGNTITAWPTKLALAPELARQVSASIDRDESLSGFAPRDLEDWPRPAVARLPWQAADRSWQRESAGRRSAA